MKGQKDSGIRRGNTSSKDIYIYEDSIRDNGNDVVLPTHVKRTKHKKNHERRRHSVGTKPYFRVAFLFSSSNRK